MQAIPETLQGFDKLQEMAGVIHDADLRARTNAYLANSKQFVAITVFGINHESDQWRHTSVHVVGEMGKKRMELLFARAKMRFSDHYNLLALDYHKQEDRHQVCRILAANDQIIEATVTGNIPQSECTKLEKAYVQGMVEAIPLPRRIQGFASRVYQSLSNFRLNPSH